METQKTFAPKNSVEWTIALLIAILFSCVLIEVVRLIRSQFLKSTSSVVTEENLNTRLTYGLANGDQPIILRDGWYYFRDRETSNIGYEIDKFIAERKNLKTLVWKVLPATKINYRLGHEPWQEMLSQNVGLTNGYYVEFIETPNTKTMPEAIASHN